MQAAPSTANCSVTAAQNTRDVPPIDRGKNCPSVASLFVSRVTDRVLSATVYPSGDFSVGVIPRKKLSQVDQEYERTKGNIIAHRYAESRNGELVQGYWYEKEKTEIPTNLVNSAKSSQTSSCARGRYGLKGITGHGKKMLRSAATSMESEWKLHNCGMGTLTLPPVSAERLRLISSRWSDVCRRFFQEIGRIFKSSTGREFIYAYCTEVQEERSASNGLPVLHIHFLYRVRKWGVRTWSLDAGLVRRIWRRIVESYVGRLDADMDCRVRLEVCRKSFVGYIGKYLSKGATSLRFWVESGYADMLPSTWWGMSASLSKQIRASCLRSMSAFADWLWQACRDGDSVVLSYSHDVCIDIQDRQIIVGYFGQADYELCKDLLIEFDMKLST